MYLVCEIFNLGNFEGTAMRQNVLVAFTGMQPNKSWWVTSSDIVQMEYPPTERGLKDLENHFARKYNMSSTKILSCTPMAQPQSPPAQG
jgi:hypothetical protein